MRPVPSLVGSQFGRWTVIARHGSVGLGKRAYHTWICRCSCATYRVMRGTALMQGTKSCGCLARENAQQMVTHGHAGRDAGPTYITWAAMIQRCTNESSPGFKNYGGRGITVCERWRNRFSAFLADMGERPPGLTIDRIDNERGYEPSNCRWATKTQQSRNRRGVASPLVAVLIRQLFTRGARPTHLARGFGVSRTTVREIADEKIWRGAVADLCEAMA